MPKIVRSPEQKSQFAPYYRYRHTHHAGKARQHTSFSTKYWIYQTVKMAFNHPSSSKNNTGVITNQQFATLPGLQPVHDGNIHKQEIPAKSLQFVTIKNASSNWSCPRPHQSFFHFSYKHENLRHPTNRCPTSANSTWCHLWGALVLRVPHQYLLFTTFLEWTMLLTRKFHPRTPILLLTWIRNYDPSTDTSIHSRLSRKKMMISYHS